MDTDIGSTLHVMLLSVLRDAVCTSVMLNPCERCKPVIIRRMVSSGMLRRVALVSEECSASLIRVTRIGERGTTLAVTSNRRTLRRNTFAACVGC
jgi:hypothetical protein